MEQAGCAGGLLQWGPRQQLSSGKSSHWGGERAASWRQHGVVEGVLHWESLVLNLGQWWEPRFGVRNRPALWPFIFLSFSCLIPEMGMAPIPTSCSCWKAKTVASLWAPCLHPMPQYWGGDAAGRGRVGGEPCRPGGEDGQGQLPSWALSTHLGSLQAHERILCPDPGARVPLPRGRV